MLLIDAFFSHDHIELLINSTGEQLFFRSREGNWLVSFY